MTEMSEKSIGEEANALLHHYIASVVSYAQEAYRPHPTASGIKEAYGRMVYARMSAYRQFPFTTSPVSLEAAITPVHFMLVNDLLLAAEKMDDWFVKALLEADPIKKEFEVRYAWSAATEEKENEESCTN